MLMTKQEADKVRAATMVEENLVNRYDISYADIENNRSVVPLRILKAIESMKKLLQSFDTNTAKCDLTVVDRILLEQLLNDTDTEVRDSNGVLWQDWEFYYDASGEKLRPTAFKYGPYNVKLPPRTEEELETARNWKLLVEEQNRLLGCRWKEVYDKGGDREVFSEVKMVKNDPERMKVNLERYEKYQELKRKYEGEFNVLRDELKRKFEEHKARESFRELDNIMLDELDVFGRYYYREYGPKKYMNLNNLKEVYMALHPAEVDVIYALFRYYDVQIPEDHQAEYLKREENPNCELDFQQWTELEKASIISHKVLESEDEAIKKLYKVESDDRQCVIDAMYDLEDALEGDTLTKIGYIKLMRQWAISLDQLRWCLEERGDISIDYSLVPDEIKNLNKSTTPANTYTQAEFEDMKLGGNNMQYFEDNDRNDNFNDNNGGLNWIEESERDNYNDSYNYDDYNNNQNNNQDSWDAWFNDGNSNNQNNNSNNDWNEGGAHFGWGGFGNDNDTRGNSSDWDKTPNMNWNDDNNNRGRSSRNRNTNNNSGRSARNNNNNRGRSARNNNSGSNWWDDYYTSNGNSNNNSSNNSSINLWGDLSMGGNSNVNWDEVDKLVEELRSNRRFVSNMSDNTYNTAWKDLLPLVYKRDGQNLQTLSNIVKALRAKAVKDGSAEYVDPRVFTRLLAEISPQQQASNGAKFSDDYSAYQNDTTDYSQRDVNRGRRHSRDDRRYRDDRRDDYRYDDYDRRRDDRDRGYDSRDRDNERYDDSYYQDWWQHPYEEYGKGAEFDDRRDGGIRDRFESGGVR